MTVPRTHATMLLAALAPLLFLPLLSRADDTKPASTDGFKRQGVFDCNQIGSYAMSVGAMSAIGGAYVPVNDAAVTLNTGLLVYKECILREVVDRERESAVSAFFKKIYTGIETGRAGNALYVKRQGQEMLEGVDYPTMLRLLQGPLFNTMHPALQGPIKRAAVVTYETRTRAPETILACGYKDDLNAALKGAVPDGAPEWDAILALGTSCNPLFAYYNAEDLIGNTIARAEQNQWDQWNWGRGYYSRVDSNGTILTPAVNVQQSFQTMLDSPVRQLESANDIGQMIGALYAGVTTQIVSDSRGLSGLSQGIGGQPSYLDQLAAESSQGVRNAAVNAALAILGPMRQVETAIYQAISAIGAEYAKAIAQLRSAEAQCWNLIIPKVCATPLARDNTCTDDAGNTLKVATTTEFSKAVIDASIAPDANGAVKALQTSRQALDLIEQMITSVTNTTSQDAQLLTLKQLDKYVIGPPYAPFKLHTQQDYAAVQQQLQGVQGRMQTLVTQTVGDANNPNGWTSSQDPAVGWCNINNPAVLQGWKDRWKKK